MNERERRVAAENHPSFAPQTIVKRPGETFDPYDRGYAERDAEKKDAQASEPAAQVANGEARHRRPRADLRESGRRVHTETAAGVSSTLPERMRITRSQRAARAASWVTSASVAPRRAGKSNIKSTIVLPVVSSRLPVGSSAISNEGRGQSARASATRCCSPPESWAG